MQTPPKTIIMATNYNNKLSCNCFLHIDRAPAQPVPECKLNEHIKIITEDGSHPPITKKVVSFIRIPLGSMVDAFSLPSHGMLAADFICWWKENNPNDPYSIELAVYYYLEV